MQKLIDAIDDLPLIIKIIFAIPALDIIWNIYRLCRSIVKNNIIGIVIAILFLTVGLAFMWLVDIICLLLNNKVWWID